MRIALLTYSTKPRGGVVHTLHLAEALAALGERVTIWTLGRGGDQAFFRPVHPSAEVVVVPFAAEDGEAVGARIIRSIATLRAAFDPTAYDIVHAEDCISANAVDDCVRTVHHIDAFTTPELVACHDRVIREPVALVCVSAAVAGEVTAGWGRSATVIPNGVDADRFAAASAAPASQDAVAWRERFGGDYLLAVGGIEPRKGTLDLLAAFRILHEARPELRLAIAGGETLFDYSAYRAAFDAEARELGDSVVRLGVIPDVELPALVSGARALPFVSTKEGFGLAAMEALAAGVPVVARDLPVLREVYGDVIDYVPDDHRFALGLADSLADALDTPRDPAAGRALAASYRWDDAARAHRALYRSILERRDSLEDAPMQRRPG